jgi:hypothetical protein
MLNQLSNRSKRKVSPFCPINAEKEETLHEKKEKDYKSKK